jgi:hypothetical protein
MKNLFAVICLIVTSAFAVAQSSDKQRPPKPSDSNASLSPTLKLIQDKVNEQGEIRYTMTSKNTLSGETVQDKYAVETSNATADSRSCTLQVDARMVLNGKTQTQGRPVVQLREITSVTVKTQSQAIEERTAQAGVTQWKGNISPESYIIQAFQSGNLSGVFFFREQETANLVAKNISHVIELCGGKKKTFPVD